MAADDPIPGSSWNGGHYYGEKIPTVRGRRATIPTTQPNNWTRGVPTGNRKAALNWWRNDPDARDQGRRARQAAIAKLTNQQNV